MTTKTKTVKSAENFILTYYQAIQDGSVNVGQWIRLLYEKIVAGLEAKEYIFDAKKANRAIRFIENYCHHSKGRNDLLKLELWQKALTSIIFGIVDENGLRIFREIVLVVARKNGKSLYAAALIACANFLDGEYGAETYIVAPKLEQANIVFSCFWSLTQAEPELKSRIVSKKDGLYIPESNGTVKKIAFSAKKSDGLNPHICVCDEIAAWPGDNGKKQYEVLKSALGARTQPLLISCTTSGYVNEGIYDELVRRGTAWLLGNSKERRLLPVFYMIDDIERWSDINEIRKANPNLGVSVSVDYMLEEISVAELSLSKKAEHLCKCCCIKQNSSTAWLSARTVEQSCREHFDMPDIAHCYAVAGIDLSRTTDLTSACLVVEKEGTLYVLSHFWLPAEKLSEAVSRDGIPYEEFIQQGYLSLSGDNFINTDDVYDWLIKAVREYEILPLIVGYDRYCALPLINKLQQSSFLCDDVFQGTNLSPVIYEMEGLMKDGVIDIGDNKLLKIHLLDSALEADTRVNKVRLRKLTQSDACHIDGVAALLDALTVRQKHWGEYGERLQNK